MRALPARRIATTTLCAALLLGTAGPAIAMQAESRQEVTAAEVPLPGADALLGQVTALGDLGGVLTPVTDLLTAALKADNGQLPAADAAKLADAVKAAIAKITNGVPAVPPAALPAVPEAPAAPAVPPAAAVPPAPAVPPLPVALPKLPLGGPQAAQAPLDLKDDALKALQTAVDALLKAVTSGDPTQVVPAVTGVLTSLVGVVVATVLGGGLPVPNLPGLPALPKLPTDALPKLPLPLALPVEE
ncbi:hypothetical protein [Streptomyces sp. NRRL B-1347]|uniref:hypothetical protein n=1 Tax=Streptomyces sp. NRRL B-1347 TaxID=1476877 RepID=UPI0004C901B7|nr:hypothetical protein [Streptomyces sp. NRRL B-1347]